MKVLIIGSGGREHAIAWKLSQSSQVEKIYTAPGNSGTAQCGENVAISDDDVYELVKFAEENAIDLVIPGPELPLTLGIADAMKNANIPCFGPNAYAAKLEGSKAFAKRIMMECSVPTAHFAVFEDFEQAKGFVEDTGVPLVIKADGLAAGKGVIICETIEQAVSTLTEIMVDKRFGKAGEKVLIEECLVGEEASFLAFCDGKDIVCMPSSQDHKPVGDGDTGANTGGMGAYSPAPVLPEKDYERMADQFIRPVVNRMAVDGHPFVGVLYAGLMMTEDGPKLLEFNVRFGDPECQPLLMRLESDLAEIMLACTEGRLSEMDIKWNPQTAIGIVMAAKGYPDSYPKGMEITGIPEADALPGTKVFQAGAKIVDGKITTSGGRVLCVTSLGNDLAQAQLSAYEAVKTVNFENCYYRNDIGDKGLK